MNLTLAEKKRRRKNERSAAMYDAEVFEMLQAIDAWRRKNNRSFPAWSEVLQILKELGWRKVASPVDAAVVEPNSTAAIEPLASDEPI